MRFITRDAIRDQIADPGTSNYYHYADGNPIMKIDPDGLYDRWTHFRRAIYWWAMALNSIAWGWGGAGPILIGIIGYWGYWRAKWIARGALGALWKGNLFLAAALVWWAYNYVKDVSTIRNYIRWGAWNFRNFVRHDH